MTGKLWWCRLVNSARFLDEIRDALADDKSVMLMFDTEIPWQDIMIETIDKKLTETVDSRTLDIVDVPDVDSPGSFLMEKYCSKEERKKYWPTTHGSPEKFLAQNKVTALNKRYVCLTGIKPSNAAKWTKSVSEYLENCDNSGEHGVFILVIEGENVAVSKQMTAFKYADYVTDYDCMMLCLTLVSDLKCSRTEKMYLCEVASNIAHNNVECAAMLVSEKLALIQDPYSVTKKIFAENGINIENLQERVRAAVWEAQIKLVFPKLENFRADLIRKYKKKLEAYLPIKNSYNEIIDNPSDLEIGQLYYICKDNRTEKITDLAEYEMLKKIRTARNILAHLEALTYKQLMEIRML